ncbi:MAG: lysophospholipid acyltransferase family protein [Jatrophihabitans sp.]|uniref:lysophospholipid acyltransferase family protein n=1 Tax=Jatrophihabitans sp. TaxID=1932789 RepID=UPI003F81173E
MSRLHKPKAGGYIRFWVALLYPLDSLFFKIRWRNLEAVPPPQDGGVIIALNHVSQVDTVLMARMVWQSGRIPRFMVKAGVFRWPIIGPLQAGAGQIPVYRGTADAAQSLRDAVTALRKGECIVIYPEGSTTKDPDGWPMQGKTGVARLALLCPEIPVIPIGQWGAQKRPGPKWLRFLRRVFTGRPVVSVSVGKPVDLERFHGCEPNGAVLREMTDLIMGAVRDEVAVLRGEPAPTEFFVPTRKHVDKTRSS